MQKLKEREGEREGGGTNVVNKRVEGGRKECEREEVRT